MDLPMAPSLGLYLGIVRVMKCTMPTVTDLFFINTTGELHFDGYNAKQRKEIENDKKVLAKKSAKHCTAVSASPLIENIDEQDTASALPLKRQRVNGLEDGEDDSVAEPYTNAM